MAIIEIFHEKVRFARCSQSYREFMERFFGFTVNEQAEVFHEKPATLDLGFLDAMAKCSENDNSLFVEERLPDGSAVNSCLRRVAINPKNGKIAIAVAVLSVKDANEGATYANIARALAADYFKLYYVDLDTEDFIEYSSVDNGERISAERHGEDFFAESRKDALEFIYHEDREKLINAFHKENVLDHLEKQGVFNLTYRLMINGEPVFVNMKAKRMHHDDGHIIIGVSNIDTQMKQKMILDRTRRNEMIYSGIMALSDDCICIYTVDIGTGDYSEYNAADSYKGLGLAKDGTDFFTKAIMYSSSVIPDEDQSILKERFTHENVMNDISENGHFTLEYHLIMSGETVPVRLKAALVKDSEDKELIIGVYRIR